MNLEFRSIKLNYVAAKSSTVMKVKDSVSFHRMKFLMVILVLLLINLCLNIIHFLSSHSFEKSIGFI